jgi:hypothetical protein
MRTAAGVPAWLTTRPTCERAWMTAFVTSSLTSSAAASMSGSSPQRTRVSVTKRRACRALVAAGSRLSSARIRHLLAVPAGAVRR